MANVQVSSLELVIFDCDGVLVDSDRISPRIQAEWISALGLQMSYQDCIRDFLGLGVPATLQILTDRLGRPLPPGWEKGLESAINDAFRAELQPIAGIINALERINVPTCVASSGSHEKMRLTLGLTGLWNHFAGRIYSGDEVENGKPAPDLFLHARATGMSVLGYAPTDGGTRLIEEGARVFKSMVELPDLLGMG